MQNLYLQKFQVIGVVTTLKMHWEHSVPKIQIIPCLAVVQYCGTKYESIKKVKDKEKI